MKHILASVFSLGILASAHAANLVQTASEPFPTVNWTSKNAAEEVTIQNGTGASLVIQIKVKSDPTLKLTGVDVKNCGETVHINAGNSAVCTTNDPKNPVTLKSDSMNAPASGEYQTKQQNIIVR